MVFKSPLCVSTAIASLLLIDVAPAFATNIEEIIVKARKRAESMQDVPVAITAFDKGMIEQSGVSSMEDVSQLTPSMTASSLGGGGPQGLISLRGVSTGQLNFVANQAVAINIDGMQIGQAIGARSAQIDLEQIEVLKGPQALFFGKNSTGGIIAFQTADPTDEFYARARTAYEFNAEEVIGEFIVSGPVTETLGARAVVHYSSQDGWLENVSNEFVRDRTIPDYNELFGRLTLTWDPTETFSARLKVSNMDYDGRGRVTVQPGNCGPAAPYKECSADDRTSIPDVPGYADYDEFTMTTAILDMSWDITDTLIVSSLTSYYENEHNYQGAAVALEPTFASIGLIGDTYVDSFAQELRLSSDLEGPINFMVGAFYDDGIAKTRVRVDLPNIMLLAGDAQQNVTHETSSVFGQLDIDLTDAVSLSLGARHSEEERTYKGWVLDAASPPFGPFPQPLIPTDDKIKSSNLSPEVSLFWRAAEGLNVYATYREGFKSGTFDAGAVSTLGLAFVPREISVDPETVKGGEIGIKSELFDNTLRFNAAVYHYEYSDLQLTSFDVETLSTTFLNAGESTVKGVEFDALWVPESLPDWTFTAAMNYNDASYDEFLADCNETQLVNGDPDCFDNDPGAGVSLAQDMAGKPLTHAPRWAGSLGANYDGAVGDGGLRLRGNIAAIYSSSYEANVGHEPAVHENGYVLVNAGVGIYDEDAGWEVDLITRNLFDEHYRIGGSNNPGAVTPNEASVNVARPREVMVRFTYTF